MKKTAEFGYLNNPETDKTGEQKKLTLAFEQFNKRLVDNEQPVTSEELDVLADKIVASLKSMQSLTPDKKISYLLGLEDKLTPEFVLAKYANVMIGEIADDSIPSRDEYFIQFKTNHFNKKNYVPHKIFDSDEFIRTKSDAEYKYILLHQRNNYRDSLLLVFQDVLRKIHVSLVEKIKTKISSDPDLKSVDYSDIKIAAENVKYFSPEDDREPIIKFVDLNNKSSVLRINNFYRLDAKGVKYAKEYADGMRDFGSLPDHPHIIKMLGLHKSHGDVMVEHIEPYITLRDQVAKNRISLHDALKILEDVGNAISFVDQNGLVFIDLNVNNIIASQDDQHELQGKIPDIDIVLKKGSKTAARPYNDSGISEFNTLTGFLTRIPGYLYTDADGLCAASSLESAYSLAATTVEVCSIYEKLDISEDLKKIISTAWDLLERFGVVKATDRDVFPGEPLPVDYKNFVDLNKVPDISEVRKFITDLKQQIKD